MSQIKSPTRLIINNRRIIDIRSSMTNDLPDVNKQEMTDTKKTPPNISEILKDWMLNTKTHGLSNIIRNENLILRIFFTACFMASCVFCIYQIVVTCLTYSQFHVITSYSTVNEAPTLFPAVVSFTSP